MIHGSGPNRTADRWRRTFIGHYIDEASRQVARFYHPVLGRAADNFHSLSMVVGAVTGAVQSASLKKRMVLGDLCSV